MVDLSYLQCMWIKQKKVGTQLPKNIILALKSSEEHLSCNKLYPVNIYHPFSQQLICPAFAVCCPVMPPIFRCFFHPAALEELQSIVWEAEVGF